jgi:hypothetical protein
MIQVEPDLRLDPLEAVAELVRGPGTAALGHAVAIAIAPILIESRSPVDDDA